MTAITTDTRKAILFLNLGGPETLKDVRPFLYELFKDPEIIKIPITPVRNFVAWMISTTREKKSQGLYKQIGGGSPIRKYTDAQSAGVEKQLKEMGCDAHVRTAFTCSPPFVEDVIRELSQQGIDQFLAFPLYPQYSYTTSRGALNRVRKAIRKIAPHASLHEIHSWPTHPLFIKAHAEIILKQLDQFQKRDNVHLLFSAHSIPEKLVSKEGDPYKNQIEETVHHVLDQLSWKGKWTLGWQSRLGPVKWLEPNTEDVIRKLGEDGEKQVLVIPIAFVSDHIETLCEIDIEYAEVAKKVGIEEFQKTEGLNTHPTFLKALSEIAQSQEKFWG